MESESQAPVAAGVQDDPSVPDVYAEGVIINGNYAGFTLIFNRSVASVHPGQAPAIPVAVVRVSPQQAYIMSEVLRKALAGYQEQLGAINLSDQILTQFGIEPASTQEQRDSPE